MNPTLGSAERFVRCSTIGIFAANSRVWAGLEKFSTSSMFQKSTPTSAALARISRSIEPSLRYGPSVQ